MSRFIMAQINTRPGAVKANQKRIAEIAAKHNDADLVVFPEMTLSGYPIGDLVERPDLLQACRVAAENLAQEFASGPAMLIGAPWQGEDLAAHIDRDQGSERKPIYNAVLLLENGAVSCVTSKYHLPNEGIFDEKRNFVSEDFISGPIEIAGMRLGVMVCHDAWFEDVAETMAESGADAFVVLNASPYQRDGKLERRFQALLSRVVETKKPLMMVNLVGAQDGVVFDGTSVLINADCSIGYQAPAFIEDIAVVDWQGDQGLWRGKVADFTPQETRCIESEVYQAICLGLKDFVAKNGFEKVVLGLSGGVDSALVAALAVDALGADQVHGVMMPSPHTCQQSLDDAADLAQRLGITLDTVPINPLMDSYAEVLKPTFALKGVAAENIQARIRGVVLMAASNQSGALLLTTGNKSEIAVGYCTLYGDMSGGFNPIADLYKTEVYELCHWRNSSSDFTAGADCIPNAILERAPSAELAPNQADSDSLPDYSLLDQILRGIIEENLGIDELVVQGLPRATVIRVLKLLDGAQHKRYQASIGVKLTSRGLKAEWRYPLTNQFCRELL